MVLVSHSSPRARLPGFHLVNNVPCVVHRILQIITLRRTIDVYCYVNVHLRDVMKKAGCCIALCSEVYYLIGDGLNVGVHPHFIQHVRHVLWALIRMAT